jgi:osmotically-inducible protein OsmY
MTVHAIIVVPVTEREGAMNKRMVLLLGLILAGCSKSDQVGSDAPNKVTGNDLGKRTEIVSNDTQSAVGKAPQTQKSSGGNQVGGPGDKDATAVVGGDTELQQRVRVAISTGSTGTSGRIAESQLLPIKVTATNGVVTLSGPIESSRKETIVDIVRGLPGVKGVQDQLSSR